MGQESRVLWWKIKKRERTVRRGRGVVNVPVKKLKWIIPVCQSTISARQEQYCLINLFSH